MAARIVYEGVAGANGNLFEGMKFWLSHRIPMRNHWREQLESNGGTIVLLEVNADVVLVDHVRKDPPAGSISWTWVEQSVKNGRLEDIENHRAGPVQAQVREVGSMQPTKKTRTKFSPEDDRILMDWVIRAERKGSSILGNTIYQQLALKYPHHTWQSWLDRWKRYVSTRKRPTLSENEEDDDDVEAEDDEVQLANAAPKSRPESGQPSNPPLVSRHVKRSSRASVSPPPRAKLHRQRPSTNNAASPNPSMRSRNSTTSIKDNIFLLESPGGNVFTDEESQLLFEAYDSVMDLSDDQVIDAWIAWSKAYPNHTPQEWRNHFKEYVAPTQQARIEAAKRTTEMPPTKNTPVRKAASTSNRTAEVKDSQDSSGQTVKTPAKEIEHCICFSDSPREFATNLLELADELGLEVDPNPVICGKTIKLFSLWRIVTSHEFGGFDEVSGRKTWGKVAERLGFEKSQQREAGCDLKSCYGEILCDLELGERELQEGEDMTSEQEAALIANQLHQPAEQPDSVNGDEQASSHSRKEQDLSVEEEEEEEQWELLREQEENDDDLDSIQISPQRPKHPSPSVGKRQLGSGRRSPGLPYNKRQKIDKGKGKEQLEIPSTPEYVINNTQMGRPPHQPSPLNFGLPKPSSSSAESSIEDIRPFRLVRERYVPSRHVEPETQDFYHPPPTYPPVPREAFDDNDEDIFISGSNPGHPEEQNEEDDVAKENIVHQESPQAEERTSHRNSSNATTRGTIHSSNTIDKSATRGTVNFSSTNYESSTQSQTESQKGALIEAFVIKHVSEGYAQDVVIEALESTSMSLSETLAVMESLANGEGIPEDVPGIWTSWDDEALIAGRGAADYPRIVRKHGISRISARKKYLKTVQAAEGL